MGSDRMTRRGYLGGVGAVFAAALAGCATRGGGGKRGTGSSSTLEPESLSNDQVTRQTSEAESPYTRVYQEVIGSVVLLRVSNGRGRTSQGSGFVYRDNYIVTNAHVVSGQAEVQVRFSDGGWRSGTVVGTDPSSDLAVVRAENPPDYATPLPMVDSPPTIGNEVVAIGSPYGLEGSLTSGLISGVNRSIPAPNGYTIPDAVQTSAPVNPGNSGGPLVNLDGRVEGVISSGGGDNLAFAISAALVERVVPALIENGEYRHAYLGVSVATVTPEIADKVGLDEPRGVLVRGVLENGPSDGTLQSGDVITGIGGQQIDSRQGLSSYLALEASPDQTVQVSIVRNGETQTVDVTLGARPRRRGSQS